MSDARVPSVYNLVPGDVLAGRYEIVREVGSGGMGRVFKAFDRALKELVAVKVLKSAPDEEARSRFLNEVKLARKIRHRNVVGLHEYGEEGGLPYFSMEFVEGEDLRHLIRARSALDWEAAYALAEQIGEGLQAAHEMGVVHRDLKPANVMIEPSGQVRVMDFGVAKGGGERGATQAGVVLGTPEYMSPEQVQAREVDPRSDLYAFAVVIYEMFTGGVPFTGPTSWATMLMQVESPLPFDPPHEFLPGPLVPILRKALAKDPDDRYASCSELLAALATARGQQGTDPLPLPSGRRDSGKDATVVAAPRISPPPPHTAVPPEARLLLPMLTRALDSPQVELRLGAIRALELHGPAAAEAVPRLESFLGDPAVGEAAALALRAIAPPEPLPAPLSAALPAPLPSRSSLPGPAGGNALRAGPEEILAAQRAAATAPDLVTPLPRPAPRVAGPEGPPETTDSRPPSASPPVTPPPPLEETFVHRPPVAPSPRVREAPPLYPAPRRTPVPAPDLARSPGGSGVPSGRGPRVAALSLAGVAVVVGLLYWLGLAPRPPAPPSVVTTTVTIPPPPDGASGPAPAVVPTTTSTTSTTSTTQRPRPDPSPTVKGVASRVTPPPSRLDPATPTPEPAPTPEPTPTPEPPTTTTTSTTTTTTTYRLVPAECESCPAPPFPEIAADPRVAAEGVIELRLLVDDKGGVAVLAAVYRPLPSRRPSTLAGQRILKDAAVAAVKKWRYRPARRGGVPVPVEVTAKAEFNLSR